MALGGGCWFWVGADSGSEWVAVAAVVMAAMVVAVVLSDDGGA